MSAPSFAKYLSKKNKRTRLASEEPIQASTEGGSGEGGSYAADVVAEIVADVSREGEETSRRLKRGAIELSSSATPSPAHSPFRSRDPVVIASGTVVDELWGKGLTPSLQEVCRPPPEFSSARPLTPDTRALLKRLEEDTYKAASLVGSFEDLHSKYSASELKYDQLMAEKTQLSLDLEGTRKRLQDAEAVKVDLQKAQADLASRETELENLRSSSEQSRKTLEDKLSAVETDLVNMETELKATQAKLTKLETELEATQAKLTKSETELEEAQDVIANAASDSFDNALAQIRVLYPDLALEGINLTNMVRDGVIVPMPLEEDE